MLKKTLQAAAVAVLSLSAAQAAELALTVELPRIDVAEYHQPYVAIWLQNADSGEVTNVAVWYQLDKDDDKGEEWLKDMRQWWRRSGRSLDMPVDGISGATRKPGVHRIDVSPIAEALAPGSYVLNVEAAREVGGRELLKIPFEWPAKTAENPSVQGASELGRIELSLAP